MHATLQATLCSQVTLNLLFTVLVCTFQMETVFGFIAVGEGVIE